MQREYYSWHSPSLDRPMELLWFGHAGPPLILFPTAFGRFWECEDRGLVGTLSDKINAGQLQVVCVDSVDAESWYSKEAHPAQKAKRHEQYDHYLRHELIPHALHRSGHSRVQVFGASIGGYHAANLAARHPEVVGKCIVFSGVYDIRSFTDGYWDERVYLNCPAAFIPNLDTEWARRISTTQWVIATGENDHLVAANRTFSALLASKGIKHHAEWWPGVFGHDWPFWHQHLRRFTP